MGSMFEVMKKLRQHGAEPDAPPETEAPVQAEAAPAPTDATESDTSAFEPETSTEAVTGATTQPTTEWDPGRIDPAVVAFHNRYSQICEQFRAVRARLLSMNPANAHRVIAITSSVPQEGKSVCALNLGIVMAEGGEHRTLVTDADFRRSSIGRMLGHAPQQGLAELIRRDASWRELVAPTPYPNLQILSPGTVPAGSFSDVLSSTATREALAQLRESFDYTFVDTPPVNTVSDVSMLAPYCDGVILVVEMHKTPEPTVQQAVRTLQANNVRILGCIASRHDDRGTHHYDRYNYYYRDA